MRKKLQKIYFTGNNLSIVQDLWQAHYQILPIKLQYTRKRYRNLSKKF